MNTLAANLRMLREYCFNQATCRACKLDNVFCENTPESWTNEDIALITDILEEDEDE